MGLVRVKENVPQSQMPINVPVDEVYFGRLVCLADVQQQIIDKIAQELAYFPTGTRMNVDDIKKLAQAFNLACNINQY